MKQGINRINRILVGSFHPRLIQQKGTDMKIEVQLYASLMQYMPGETGYAPCLMEVAEGTTVGGLLASLKIPAGLAKLVFRNGVHAREEDVLQDGDRVAAFPPIAGG